MNAEIYNPLRINWQPMTLKCIKCNENDQKTFYNPDTIDLNEPYTCHECQLLHKHNEIPWWECIGNYIDVCHICKLKVYYDARAGLWDNERWCDVMCERCKRVIHTECSVSVRGVHCPYCLPCVKDECCILHNGCWIDKVVEDNCYQCKKGLRILYHGMIKSGQFPTIGMIEMMTILYDSKFIQEKLFQFYIKKFG